ncbi:hypothetical protein [Paucibacter soli]|uniref:hypothetical protein n=1 Tax=Paucibacter soli TaxID=3133433 RepID=UPI003095B294
MSALHPLKALNALRLRRKAARAARAAQAQAPAADQAYLMLEPGSYQVQRSGADRHGAIKPKR